MEHAICWARWVLAVATVMASPIVLMLVVPLVMGIAFEAADLRSERMLVLVLCAPAGVVLLRRLAGQRPPRRSAATV